MLFVRWQGLRTQLNMCNPDESKGGFRLIAGDLNGGLAYGLTALEGALLACGGLLGKASEQFAIIGGLRTGIIRGDTYQPRTSHSWLIERDNPEGGKALGAGKGDFGIEALTFRPDETAAGRDRNAWTQGIGTQFRLHALFTTLNIRDRQSHVRRLCRSAMNGDHLKG